MEMEIDSSDSRMPPTGIQYKLQPMGLEASSNHREFYPENGATQYGPSGSGKSNIIRIPLNVQGLIDGRHSYLKFTFTNNTAAPVVLWPSAHNLIRRLRILSSSNVELERTDNYNNLYSALADVLMPRSYRATVGNACEGFTDSIGWLTASTTAGTAVNISEGRENNDDCIIADSASRGFALPLLSGFLNSKYIPSFAVGGQGVVLEIELEAGNTAFYSATANANYTLSEVRFIADVIDMSPDFYQSFREALKMRPIQWGNVCYYGTTSTVASGTSINAILGLKFRSINAIITTLRLVANINAASKYGMYRLPLNDGNTAASYQYRIGSKLYPQSQISVKSTDVSQAFQETMKAFSAVGNVQTCGSLARHGFGAVPGDGTTEIIGPVYAIDLANYSQDVSVRESGLDTSSNGLMVELVAQSVNNAANATGAKQVDAYAQYDCVWTLDGMGNLTAQA